MRPRLVIAVAVAALGALALAACGGDSSPASSPSPEETPQATTTATPRPTATPTPAPTRPPAPASTPGVFGCPPGQEESAGLISDLSFGDGRSEFALGEPIPMTLTLVNCSAEQTRLFYKDGQRYEFKAADAQGREVWHWSHDMGFGQAAGQETIEPGATVAYAEVWDGKDDGGQPVEPGRYEIFGFAIGCATESATAEGCHFGVGLSISIKP